MIYFHSFKNPGLVLDIVSDIRALNELSRKSRKAGMIILGGGVCKHQIANAMLIVGCLLSLQARKLIAGTAQWCRLLCIYRRSLIIWGVKDGDHFCRIQVKSSTAPILAHGLMRRSLGGRSARGRKP